MMKRWSGIGLLLGMAVALQGCESNPTEREADASLEAKISGASNSTFEGTGHFYDLVAPPSFRLVAHGKAGSENQTLQIGRMSARRPAVGKYPLGLRTEILAHFSRTGNNGTYEAFATSSGELEITISRADRVEGTFRISGFRFCLREQQQTGSRTGVACAVPTAEDPSAPKVEVSGSFVAVPGS
jgi:hypothetical protein